MTVLVIKQIVLAFYPSNEVAHGSLGLQVSAAAPCSPRSHHNPASWNSLTILFSSETRTVGTTAL